MAMGTERSKPLHNFTLPCDLRWGNQRFLRCMKVNSGGKISTLRRVDNNSSGSSDHQRHHHQQLPIQHRRTTRDRERERNKESSSVFADGSLRPDRTPSRPAAEEFGGRRFRDDEDDGIAATREKVMLDLQTAADKMKIALFKDGGLEEGEVSVSQPLLPPQHPTAEMASADGEIHRPWNLRTRRAAFKTPATGFRASAGGENNGGSSMGLRVDAPRPSPISSQMRAPVTPATAQKYPINWSDGAGTASCGDKKERAKFSVSLSKREIEEDFFSIAGHRPPRRPKKRARFVQKQLDTLFPGLWLTEVTPDMYKVPEASP